MDHIMEELRVSYQRGLVDNLDSLEASGRDLRRGETAALESIRRVAHMLKGSGTTFGFPAITDAARRLEEADAGRLPLALNRLCRELREVTLGLQTVSTE